MTQKVGTRSEAALWQLLCSSQCPTGAAGAAAPRHPEHPAALEQPLSSGWPRQSWQHREGLTQFHPSCCWSSLAQVQNMWDELLTPHRAPACPHTSQELSCPFPEACIEQRCMSCATPGSNSCSRVRTEIFTYLLHKADAAIRHFRTCTQQHTQGKLSCSKQRKTTWYTQVLSRVLDMSLVFRRWCCCASPQIGSLRCHCNQRKNSEWQVFAHINTRLTDQQGKNIQGCK